MRCKQRRKPGSQCRLSERSSAASPFSSSIPKCWYWCKARRRPGLVTEFLAVRLLRGGDSPSPPQLKAKAGDTSFALWAKRYGDFLLAQVKPWSVGFARAEKVFGSPWAWHQEFPLLDVPDLAWMTGAPRVLILAVNPFNQEIRGLLVLPGHAKALNKVKDFWTEFELLVQTSTSKEAADEAATESKKAEEAAKPSEDEKDSMAKLWADIERMAAEMLSQRLVVLEQSAPAHTQLTALLQAQDMCKSGSQPFVLSTTRRVRPS